MLLSNEFDEVALQLDIIMDTIKDRGRDFSSAISSLNDSMTEGLMDMLGHTGSDCAATYADSLLHAVDATRDLKDNAYRFAPLASDMKEIYHQIIENRARLIRIAREDMEGQRWDSTTIQALNMIIPIYETIWDNLDQGGHELARYLKRAQYYQPNVALEKALIKKALEQDISDSRKSNFYY